MDLAMKCKFPTENVQLLNQVSSVHTLTNLTILSFQYSVYKSGEVVEKKTVLVEVFGENSVSE